MKHTRLLAILMALCLLAAALPLASAEEDVITLTIARKTDTISYEVLCGVSRRVPRVYRDHDGIVAVENWILEA